MTPLAQILLATVGGLVTIITTWLTARYVFAGKIAEAAAGSDAWLREQFAEHVEEQKARLATQDQRIRQLERHVAQVTAALAAKDQALKICNSECDRLRTARDECLKASRELYRQYAELKQRAQGT